MTERRADAARRARLDGRYGGGAAIPPGYVPAGGRFLKDPEYGRQVRQMALDAIAGRSLSWIARRLNAEAVASPKGAKRWTFYAVNDILKNPGLAGIITLKGQVVRDGGGQPEKFTDDPVISDDEWARLCAGLASRSHKRTGRKRHYLLAHIAFCPCGKRLYGTARKSGHAYYRCQTSVMTHAQACGAKMTPMAALEEAVEAAVLRMCGDHSLPAMMITPGSGPGIENPRIPAVTTEPQAYPAVRCAGVLAAVPQPPDPESAGITLAESLVALDRAAKRAALRRLGVRVTASMDPGGRLTGWIQAGYPEEPQRAPGIRSGDARGRYLLGD